MRARSQAPREPQTRVAIDRDRFRVSEHRQLGGMTGGEDFFGRRIEFTPLGGIFALQRFLIRSRFPSQPL
jgi:hypothetical protein